MYESAMSQGKATWYGYQSFLDHIRYTPGTSMPKQTTRPNILLLMVDQWRADYLGFLNNQSHVITPNLDRLRQRSCHFPRAVTPNPVCQPARSAYFTGKYPHQIQLTAMNGDLRPDMATMPQALQQQGYSTAIIGKLHFIHHHQPGREDFPRAREGQKRLGFDYIWEAAGKELAGKHYCDWSHVLDKAGQHTAYRNFLQTTRTGGYQEHTPLEQRWQPFTWPLDDELYVDNQIGARANAYLNTVANKNQPFFLQVSFCGPHPPYDPPKAWLDAIPEEVDENYILTAEQTLSATEKKVINGVRRCYRAMMYGIDQWIGTLLDQLDALNISDNTLIAFVSDHGEMLGDMRRYNKQIPHWASSHVFRYLSANQGSSSQQRMSTPWN